MSKERVNTKASKRKDANKHKKISKIRAILKCSFFSENVPLFSAKVPKISQTFSKILG